MSDNPPAFPRTGEGFGNPLYDTPGMSLRDWFAGQALAGMLPEYLDRNGFHETAAQNSAVHAYRFADAMLTARKAGEQAR